MLDLKMLTELVLSRTNILQKESHLVMQLVMLLTISTQYLYQAPIKDDVMPDLRSALQAACGFCSSQPE